MSTQQHILLNALIGQALKACSAECELTWARGKEARFNAQVLRDRAVGRCEKLLVYAVSQQLLSESGARRLAGVVYDALALERRAVKGRLFKDEPEGHWDRVDSLSRSLSKTWRRDRRNRFTRWF